MRVFYSSYLSVFVCFLYKCIFVFSLFSFIVQAHNTRGNISSFYSLFFLYVYIVRIQYISVGLLKKQINLAALHFFSTLSSYQCFFFLKPTHCRIKSITNAFLLSKLQPHIHWTRKMKQRTKFKKERLSREKKTRIKEKGKKLDASKINGERR